MVKNALGLIEVVGLAAGMEAADAALKAANIELLGYELIKGEGRVVIKLCGDVGAIKAAVEAGAIAAGKVSKVCATHVIPRPHHELGGIVDTKETIGRKGACVLPITAVPVVGLEMPDQVATAGDKTAERQADTIENAHEADSSENMVMPTAETCDDEGTGEPQTIKKTIEICNLCGDPACPRKKGDPKIMCIHFDRNNKEDE